MRAEITSGQHESWNGRFRLADQQAGYWYSGERERTRQIQRGNHMRRRDWISAMGATGLLKGATPGAQIGCGCAFAPQEVVGSPGIPPGSQAFKDVGSKMRITGMKVFGVTLDEKIARADRPYVFVKLETNQGVVGWGEATLEGKAAAAMACVNDLKDFIIGSDPMQVEHLYQLMYIGSFYRGGPVLGSAISGIDQAIWDIRGKVLGQASLRIAGRACRSARCPRLLPCFGANDRRDASAA